MTDRLILKDARLFHWSFRRYRIAF